MAKKRKTKHRKHTSPSRALTIVERKAPLVRQSPTVIRVHDGGKVGKKKRGGGRRHSGGGGGDGGKSMTIRETVEAGAEGAAVAIVTTTPQVIDMLAKIPVVNTLANAPLAAGAVTAIVNHFWPNPYVKRFAKTSIRVGGYLYTMEHQAQAVAGGGGGGGNGGGTAPKDSGAQPQTTPST